MRHRVENGLFSMIYYNFKVKEGDTKARLNYIFDGGNNFLRLPKLLHDFLQQDQISGVQKAVDHLNIFDSTLDACKDVNPVTTFHTMVLICYNGASF